jgi:hypothetical protein
MNATGQRHKLAAILAADAAVYSRLMAAEEVATLALELRTANHWMTSSARSNSACGNTSPSACAVFRFSVK